MNSRRLLPACMSVLISFLLTLASCPALLSAASLSQQEESQLRQPHGRLFYLYAKTVNVNTQESLLKAKGLIDQGQDYPLALAILNQVIAVDKTSSEAFLLRALCHTEMSKFDEAEEDYLNALRLEPENPTFYRYRGESFLRWQDYAEAKGINYGWDGMKPNRLYHAERMYKKALEIAPYYLDGIVGLGDTYARMGKWGKKKFARNLPKAAAFYEQAIGEYNKVLALFPEHGPVIAKKQDAQSELLAIQQAEQNDEARRKMEERIR